MAQLGRDLLQLIVQHAEVLKPTQSDGKDRLVFVCLTEKHIIFW